MVNALDVNIRKAESKDKPQVVELIIQFYQESLREYGLSFSYETLVRTVQNFIDNYIGIVAEEGDKIVGVIGGTISNSIFDDSQKIGQESMWYVSQEYRKGRTGLYLIKAFEEECIKRGANHIILIHMSNLYPELLDRLYKICGFRLLEMDYIKGVGNEII